MRTGGLKEQIYTGRNLKNTTSAQRLRLTSTVISLVYDRWSWLCQEENGIFLPGLFRTHSPSLTMRKNIMQVLIEGKSTKYPTSSFQNCQGHQKHQDLWNCCNQEEYGRIWQPNVKWDPWWDPGQEDSVTEKLKKYDQGFLLVIMHQYLFLDGDKCTIVMKDINCKGNWVWYVWKSPSNLHKFL